MMNSDKFLQSVKEKVRQIDGSAEVILFGSRARRTATENSDWDFLILLDSPVDEKIKGAIRDSLFDIEIESNQVISTIIHSKNKWNDLSITPLFRNIQQEGVVI